MEIIAELVAFVIVILVIWRFVVPVLKKMVTARQDTVQQQVDEAEEATRKLNEAQAKLESAVEEARQEAARIRDDARADATRIHDELVEQAKREIERTKARGGEQLAAQRDQVVRQMRAELGAQSYGLAEKLVVESLADESARRASVDDFLDDIDRLVEARAATSADAPATAGGGA
ncbi:ATP synthase subunit b [Pseudonocardia dioxanivorans CB1190]|uniref:ATP synthase subunit b n=1 Tax=Pseudonocardia dioxanivorans (strain ATCC 55486 / DSM 44775 / JCM 13855 / CB1190) TaxID=675635 RepID=F4CJ66_PSEUX|nr:F0F1 ATP synthase subunit B [Pseudonocardia dioxanivorans]AEA23916.1 ATP synthase subunit b [Pseudonocardia dioxanivorans CB1190]